MPADRRTAGRLDVYRRHLALNDEHQPRHAARGFAALKLRGGRIPPDHGPREVQRAGAALADDPLSPSPGSHPAHGPRPNVEAKGDYRDQGAQQRHQI
eukprot:10947718-Lingulodinium_polyedra.AAC.1